MPVDVIFPSKGYLLQNSDDTFTIANFLNTAQFEEVIVDEAVGIGLGKCCFLTGASGDIPTIALASISNGDHVPAYGVSVEAKADGQTIRIVKRGTIPFDTTAMMKAAGLGDILYLGEDGNLESEPTAGLNGNLQVARVTKTGVDGLITIELDSFVLSANFDGVLRSIIENTSDGIGAAASFTSKNDAAHIVSFGITSSGGAFPEASFFFSDGFGETTFFIDGDKSFTWFSDVTDSHNFSSTKKMELSSAGFLRLNDANASINAFLDEDDMASNSATALPTQQSVKAFASHDRQEVEVDGPINTMSTSFVNIPGAELVTVDLGQSGIYLFWLSISVQQSNNNTSITFRALVDGVPGMERTVDFGPNAANDPQHATLIGKSVSISAETLIEIQWKVSGGTGQINDLTMLLDGIPESRIVPLVSPGVDSYLTEAGDALLKEDDSFLLIQ